jgi:hypothetical protein
MQPPPGIQTPEPVLFGNGTPEMQQAGKNSFAPPGGSIILDRDMNPGVAWREHD